MGGASDNAPAHCHSRMWRVRSGMTSRPVSAGKLDKSRPATSSEIAKDALVRSRPPTTPMSSITMSDPEGQAERVNPPLT
jgi:hypothetical protein